MGVEARKFELQLSREWLDAQEDTKEAVELIALETFKRVVEKSPVGTGRFRGNWNASIGSMDESTTETVDKTGGPTIARAAAVFEAYSTQEAYPDIHITNGLPYAQRLEDGHSMQAPSGMVALTITEINAMFDGYEV